MKYLIYQGEVVGTYELLTNNGIYYVPMSMSTEKAHKQAARDQRIERIWDWIVNNDGKVGIIIASVVFIGIVLLSIP